MNKNKSLDCPIQDGMEQIVRALDETERFAKEEKMQKRDALHLRLLAEELLGMAGTLLQVKDGMYWIEKNENDIDLHLIVKARTGSDVENALLSISSDHKNAAYAGVKGRIIQFLDMFNDASGVYSLDMIEQQHPYIMHTNEVYEWSYRLYTEELRQDSERVAEWDELEKSVLTKLTRDIVVGVRPNSVEIVLKAKI